MTLDIDLTRRAATPMAIAMMAICGLLFALPATGSRAETTWRSDPAWHNGKAEWALYEAQREIYGKPRRYDATIFTNTQIMDPGTTTKTAHSDRSDGVAVFKHNVSELIETDNYTYRFLTTCFVRTNDLKPFKIVSSSQEDCGSSYKQFTIDSGQVNARQFGYFPEEGSAMASFRATDDLRFHDALTLTLRDYPFEDASPGATTSIALVGELTDNHWSKLTPSMAELRYIGRETIDVPYGRIDTFHLQVTHNAIGGGTTSDYWFATDRAMRHVLVQYHGPFGVQYRLKRLAWWAYWAEPKPK